MIIFSMLSMTASIQFVSVVSDSRVVIMILFILEGVSLKAEWVTGALLTLPISSTVKTSGLC